MSPTNRPESRRGCADGGLNAGAGATPNSATVSMNGGGTDAPQVPKGHQDAFGLAVQPAWPRDEGEARGLEEGDGLPGGTEISTPNARQ
jgi:hypothetical protein